MENTFQVMVEGANEAITIIQDETIRYADSAALGIRGETSLPLERKA